MAQVRTRKRGKTWSYIFEAGIVDGKRKVIEKGGYPTKDAAYKAGVERYTDHIHGDIGITSESITLADFMTSWLENVVASGAKQGTLQNYQSYFKNHVHSQLGKIKVQDLTPAVLDKWVRGLQMKGYAHNTITSIMGFLHTALNYAVYPAQLISSNPVAYIKVPKNTPRRVIKRTIITPEQFQSLLIKYPFGTPLHIPLLLLYYTGMRIGEVLGLVWQDIDFNRKQLKVSRQVVYLVGKKDCLVSPKTETSCRVIPIGDFLLQELLRWRALQLQREEKLGNQYIYLYRAEDGRLLRQSKLLPLPLERIDLVCTREHGHAVQKKFFSKHLHADGLNAHSFRHTHATRLMENGATAKGVAERLGHASVEITQNLYTHTTSKLREETAAIFERFSQTTNQCRQNADKI